jgi:hypothetical protein
MFLDLNESIRYYVTKLQTRGNMKLHFETSQLALTWILWLWFQVHWGNMGNGCHVNVHVLCITECHVLWVVWNFHSFPNLELRWSSSLIIFAIIVFHHFIFVYMAKKIIYMARIFYPCGKSISKIKRVKCKCSLFTFTIHSSWAHLVIMSLILISVFFTKESWDVLINQNEILLIWPIIINNLIYATCHHYVTSLKMMWYDMS